MFVGEKRFYKREGEGGEKGSSPDISEKERHFLGKDRAFRGRKAVLAQRKRRNCKKGPPGSRRETCLWDEFK